jgi:hypothetical protein
MSNQSYREKKINENIALLNNFLSKIYNSYFLLENCDYEEEEDYIRKDIDHIYYDFEVLLKKTYILVLTYIEAERNFELLTLYKEDLKEMFLEEFKPIKSEYVDEIEETFYVSDSLNKIKHYLIPFSAFDSEIIKTSGIIYLENILENTSIIIKELKIKPTNEAQVYSAVKFTLKSTFPDSVHLSEPFYKTAKCYKPDILIPSIYTAVEYKYAEDEQKLIKTIEEILIDVSGYSNHAIYKLFYAVFYVKPGIVSEQRFKIIWNDNKFPNNWKPIFVIGE